MGWHGGFPAGRLWVFASEHRCRNHFRDFRPCIPASRALANLTGFPDPVPRIEPGSCRLLPIDSHGFWVQRVGGSKVSHLRFDASLAAILARIVQRMFYHPLVSGSPIAGRRLPPCPQLLASHGHCLESRTPYQEPFPLPQITLPFDQTLPSLWTLGQNQPVIPRVPFIR